VVYVEPYEGSDELGTPDFNVKALDEQAAFLVVITAGKRALPADATV
jgi:hypothetical protein